MNKTICACGCNQTLEPFDKKGRPKKYIWGHNARAKFMKDLVEESKKCNLCGKILPSNNFYTRKFISKITGEEYVRLRLPCKKCEQTWRKTNGDKTKIAHKKHREKYKNDVKHWIMWRLTSWKQKTKNSNLNSEYLFNLYKQQNGKCYYTGNEMIICSKDNWQPTSISLDRLDPLLGYMQGNVVFCQYSINTMKGSCKKEEFFNLMKHILFHCGS